jgi:hypothetical protein
MPHLKKDVYSQSGQLLCTAIGDNGECLGSTYCDDHAKADLWFETYMAARAAKVPEKAGDPDSQEVTDLITFHKEHSNHE